MVKRLVCFFLINSILFFPSLQAHGNESLIHKSSFSSALPLGIIALNAFLLNGFTELYHQKDEKIKAIQLSLLKEEQRKTKQDKLKDAEKELLPVINACKKERETIRKLINSNKEKNLFIGFYSSLIRLLKERLRNPNNTLSFVMKQFTRHLMIIENEVNGMPRISGEVEILSNVKANFERLKKWSKQYDNDIALQERRNSLKINVLQRQKNDLLKERDNVWVFPVAVNGLVALACGLHYYLNIK